MSGTSVRPAVPVPSAPAGTGRLAWLDALRGLGALAVAFHHATYHYLPEFRRQMLAWFDPGTYGVLVFFLVSGYIIPASLERTGSLRRFWLGRVFRIYPLLGVALGAAVLQALLSVYALRGGLDRAEPVTAVLAHLTMLQDLTGVPNAINVLWTLSYEMAFYLMVVAAFVLGVHRRSASIAVGLAGFGLVLGGLLPAGAAISRGAGTLPVTVVTALVVAVAIGTALHGGRRLAAAAAVAGGALAVVLVAGNGRIGAWQGLVVLAVMFTGTVVHRAERRQIPRRRAAAAVAGVLGCAVAAGAWHLRAENGAESMAALAAQRTWAGAVVLAALTFGAGLALRRRHLPAALVRLGVISYSVYLLHTLLLVVGDRLVGRAETDRPLMLAAFFVVLLPLCWATHRWIELPGQRLGRRLAARSGN
ncbi:acyltransferase [Actinomadura craniellae]|uniref:Acyltransferase n=1 Tax=Actinomadura craniellae TaxID=2231787 RepID=A0A365H456_9ACTN|nr:acyltransferase [Actinomadura craniellae]RAY13895.1 acyltransferase [Actinomadura craniellae]